MTAAGAKTRKVWRTCCVCHAEYEVAVNMRSRSTRCLDCQYFHTLERQDVWRRKNLSDKSKPAARNWSARYRITHDPEPKSWTLNTSLSEIEIGDLCMNRHIEIGTRFVHQDGREFEIIKVNGTRRLEPK